MIVSLLFNRFRYCGVLNSTRMSAAPASTAANASANNLFPIDCKALTGTVIPLMVHALYTIEQVKQLYEVATSIPANCQRYIFAGKRLVDEKTLADYVCNVLFSALPSTGLC
jgi:large subunit ribosomal protein L40e/small subunit ribosomal protein S27Ae/ubiquitin C